MIAGTILGRVGPASLAWDKGTAAGVAAARHLKLARAPHLRFEIRPSGTGAPRIDPTPILDGWHLLASTNVYGSSNPLLAGSAGAGSGATIGQILLMSKETLERRVLADPAVQIYPCGRTDIQAGAIDRRVLATLEFLAASGLQPTVSTLKCGHSYLTTSGNVSEHSSGNAVDIGAINGTVITPATQGPGSITDTTVRKLLTLQGAMKPHQIITLMQYAGIDNTLALRRPLRPHPRRVPAALRREHQDRQGDRDDPQARAVEPAHRPHQRDPESDGAGEAEQVCAEGEGPGDVALEGTQRAIARCDGGSGAAGPGY